MSLTNAEIKDIPCHMGLQANYVPFVVPLLIFFFSLILFWCALLYMKLWVRSKIPATIEVSCKAYIHSLWTRPHNPRIAAQ